MSTTNITTHFPFVSNGAKHMSKHLRCYGSSSLSNVVPDLMQCGNVLAEHTSFDKSPHKASIGVRSGERAATSGGLRVQSTDQRNVNSGTREHLSHNDMVTEAAPILDSFQWMSPWLQFFHWMLMDVLARAPLPVIQCAWTCLPMYGLFYLWDHRDEICD